MVESNEVTSQRIASKTGFGGGIRVRSGNALVQYDYDHTTMMSRFAHRDHADGRWKILPRKWWFAITLARAQRPHAGRGVLSVVDSITELTFKTKLWRRLLR
jgi:hypothetical protein